MPVFIPKYLQAKVVIEIVGIVVKKIKIGIL
jgi:hypothetical protein